MKKTLSIVMFVLLVFLAVACSPETKQHEHSYEKVAEKSYAATCKNTGLDVYSCTGCGDTYSVTLPLTGHSHSEKASPVSVDQELYCSQDGIYTYRCNVCGTEYQEVITPEEAKAAGEEVPHAVIKELTLDSNSKKVKVYVPYQYDSNFDTESKYSDYDDNTVTKDDVNYFEDKLVEATYFTPESYEGYCKSCGEALGYMNKAVETDETVSYKEIIGTWVYKDGNGNTYYIDMKTSTDTKGKVSCSGQIVDTNADNKTTIATMGASYAVEIEDTADGENTRAVKITYNPGTAVYYHISLDSKTGKYTLTSGDATFKNAGNSCLTSEGSSLNFVENHNHRYNQSAVTSKSSDSAKAASIHLDENFKVMTHLGQNYILSGIHFLSCSRCGMSYIECSHNYIDGICSSCGYTDDGEEYIALDIGYRLDPDLTEAKTCVDTQAKKMGAANEAAAAKTANAGDEDRSAAKKALTDAAIALKKAATVLKEAGDSDSASATETAAGNAEAAAAAITSDTKDLTNAAGAIGASNSEGAWGALTEALEKLDALEPDSVDGDAAEDRWMLKKGSTLILSAEKYMSFRGKKFEFAGDTSWNFDADQFVVSGDEYKIVRGPATLTFALKTYVEEA